MSLTTPDNIRTLRRKAYGKKHAPAKALRHSHISFWAQNTQWDQNEKASHPSHLAFRSRYRRRRRNELLTCWKSTRVRTCVTPVARRRGAEPGFRFYLLYDKIH